MKYPNLTVCFAKFFDKSRLQGKYNNSHILYFSWFPIFIDSSFIFDLTAEGISNNLANYMTMALDPNVGNIVEFMGQEIPSYTLLLQQLQVELDIKLISSGLTLPELFHKVAVR